MKVRIEAGGREVEIECPDANVTVSDVAAEALGVWKATDGAGHGTEGPAYGFNADRRPSPNASPAHTGRFGIGRIGEVEA